MLIKKNVNENSKFSCKEKKKKKNMCAYKLKKGSLTLACWVVFMLMLLSADFFQNQLKKKKSFMNTIRMSNSLDPDPDLDPCCLQR